MYVPDRGDIIWLDFEPGAGKEITKRRPAYVVSRKRFNEHTGFALVAPVTSTVRNVHVLHYFWNLMCSFNNIDPAVVVGFADALYW